MIDSGIKYFAALGIGAFILFILFGSLNYVKTEMNNSGVQFTVPDTLSNSIDTSANFSGIALIILAVVGLVSIVGSLMLLFGGPRGE